MSAIENPDAEVALCYRPIWDSILSVAVCCTVLEVLFYSLVVIAFKGHGLAPRRHRLLRIVVRVA